MNEEEKIRYQITLNLERNLSEIGILRYQIITIISGLSIALSGLSLSMLEKSEINGRYLFFSLIIFIFVTLIGITIYLSQTRDALERAETISEHMKSYKLTEMPQPPKPKHSFWWPEILTGFFMLGILFFLLGILNLYCTII